MADTTVNHPVFTAVCEVLTGQATTLTVQQVQPLEVETLRLVRVDGPVRLTGRPGCRRREP